MVNDELRNLEESANKLGKVLDRNNERLYNTYNVFRDIVKEISNVNLNLKEGRKGIEGMYSIATQLRMNQENLIRVDKRSLDILKDKFESHNLNLKTVKDELSILKSKEKLTTKEKETLIEIQGILNKNTGYASELEYEFRRQYQQIDTLNKGLGVLGTGFKAITRTPGLATLARYLDMDAAIDSMKSYSQIQAIQIKNSEKYEGSLNVIRDSLRNHQIKLEDINGEYEDIIKNLRIQESLLENTKDEEERKKIKSEIKKFDSSIEKILTKQSRVKEKINNQNKELLNLESQILKESISGINAIKIFGRGLSTVSNSLAKNLTDVGLILGWILATTNRINQQTTNLQKNLALSYKEAANLRKEIQLLGTFNSEVAILSRNIFEAQVRYNEALGAQGKINLNNTITQARLVELVGVQEASAVNIQYTNEALGNDLTNNYKTLLRTTQTISQQLGVQLNHRQVLDDIGRSSAYNLAQFGGSVEALAESVALSKALNISFNELNIIAGNLLNFESSITSELEAELLIGRQINLEKARQYALTNDITNLQKELVNEIGSFNDFSNLNVIQQQSLAKALGTNVQHLSDMLLRQEYLNENGKLIKNITDDELRTRVEMLSTQERFQKAVTQVHDTFANIITVLNPLLIGLNKILENQYLVYGISTALATLYAKNILVSISKMGESFVNILGSLNSKYLLEQRINAEILKGNIHHTQKAQILQAELMMQRNSIKNSKARNFYEANLLKNKLAQNKATSTGLALELSKTKATMRGAVAAGWKSAMSGPKSLLSGGVIGLAMGAAITAAILASTRDVKDAIIGKNDLEFSGAKGSIAGGPILLGKGDPIRFDPEDTIVAGTKLGSFKQKEESQSINNININLDPLLNKLNKLEETNNILYKILNKSNIVDVAAVTYNQEIINSSFGEV